ncbi:glycosyltransferase family 2 protein [Novispirillum itersonii]|uniref:glycosyltransferase family 2 protein n=1 Tax=Novispirillum itersonii TaxID=189 RepID=UPI000361D61E|nr:glycosyltransferase family 2 protein [Novispirillum itersonii]
MTETALYRGLRVALIVPCYNEAVAIGQVIDDFRAAMPELGLYVFDNASTDDTASVARHHGAQVVHVAQKGKGNVVRRMFADVEADVYVMVDGDATYSAPCVRSLIDTLLDQRLDMVVGARQTPTDIAGQAYRKGHQWGNRMLTGSVAHIFGGSFRDMLSGYRIFSRRYAKSFPALSQGFEIETELTVHALELRMAVGEVDTPYGARPEGSVSKLSTYRDGWRILKTIMRLYVLERPLAFYSIVGGVLAVLSVLLSVPLLLEYLHSGLVPRLPTAVLSTALMLTAFLSFLCGLTLDTVTRGRHEAKRLAYLAIPHCSTIKRD